MEVDRKVKTNHLSNDDNSKASNEQSGDYTIILDPDPAYTIILDPVEGCNDTVLRTFVQKIELPTFKTGLFSTPAFSPAIQPS